MRDLPGNVPLVHDEADKYGAGPRDAIRSNDLGRIGIG